MVQAAYLFSVLPIEVLLEVVLALDELVDDW